MNLPCHKSSQILGSPTVPEGYSAQQESQGVGVLQFEAELSAKQKKLGFSEMEQVPGRLGEM